MQRRKDTTADDSVSSDDAGMSPRVVDASLGREATGKGDDIRTDASFGSRDRDAPGQSCWYIPPGDHRIEFYRLGTLAKFPKESPVKPTEMAAAGFYYTGYKDRVKCFSCGMAVENWIMGDDGMDTRWHKDECRMATGQDFQNKSIQAPTFRSLFRQYKGDPYLKTASPLGNFQQMQNDITDVMKQVNLDESTLPPIQFSNIVDREYADYLKRTNLRSEIERRKTFEKWPSYPAPFLVSDLAKEGFFYLGNLDRTQCFSCSGVLRNWAPTDKVSEQHERHFKNCRIVRGMYSGNVPMPDSQRAEMDTEYRKTMQRLTANNGEPSDPSEDEQRMLADRFPCRNPVNLHMTDFERRKATFDYRWPKNRIRASIDQIAKAGFFFLGESDKTKCFYCNGGLQNWDPNDEPWTEHAKWFPGCEYVIRQKGVEFVRRLKEAHPNLNRPFIRNPVSLDVLSNSERRVQHNINIPQILNMGITQNQIDRAIARRGNRRYESSDELIDDIFEQQEEPMQQATTLPPLSQVAAAAPVPSQQTVRGTVHQLVVPVNAGSKREGSLQEAIGTKKTRTSTPETSIGIDMADSLREMEDAVLCRKCKKNKSDMTLLPCGHLCLCEGCSTDIKRCVICNSKVQRKMKVYRA